MEPPRLPLWLKEPPAWLPTVAHISAVIVAIVTVLGICFALYSSLKFRSDINISVDRNLMYLPPSLLSALTSIDNAFDEMQYGLRVGANTEVQPPALDDIRRSLSELTATDSDPSAQNLNNELSDDVLYKLREIDDMLLDLMEWSDMLALTKSLADRISKVLNRKPVLDVVLRNNPTFGRLSLVLMNQSQVTISGLGLRVSGISRLWDVEVEGTFLTPLEKADISSGLHESMDDDAILMRTLPDIPPDSSFDVTIYVGDDPEYIEIQMSSPGYSYEINEWIKIEDTWLLYLTRNPPLVLMMISVIGPFVVLFIYSVGRTWRSSILRKGAPYVLYDAACDEARDGRLEVAMTLLSMSVGAGYRNRAHMARDEDLRELRKREDFKGLLNRISSG